MLPPLTLKLRIVTWKGWDQKVEGLKKKGEKKNVSIEPIPVFRVGSFNTGQAGQSALTILLGYTYITG